MEERFHLELALLRHGSTKGNEEHRYVGRTDEELSDAGRRSLLAEPVFAGFVPEAVFVSPMRRCIQTASLCWPGTPQYGAEGLRETDFGEFEYKTYEELKDCPSYRAWIAGGGKLAPPGGEDGGQVRRRVLDSFLWAVEQCRANRWHRAAIVAHGGTFLYLLGAYAQEQGDFYRWQARNGEGWLARWEEETGRLAIVKEERRGDFEPVGGQLRTGEGGQL